MRPLIKRRSRAQEQAFVWAPAGPAPRTAIRTAADATTDRGVVIRGDYGRARGDVQGRTDRTQRGPYGPPSHNAVRMALNPWHGLRNLPAEAWIIFATTLVNRAGTMVL